MSELGQFAMFLAVAVGAIAIFFGPIGSAVARRIDGTKKERSTSNQPIGELQRRIEQLEADRVRLAELEERIDFAERMLAQQRDPGRIGS